jgi:hypothetical protein
MGGSVAGGQKGSDGLGGTGGSARVREIGRYAFVVQSGTRVLKFPISGGPIIFGVSWGKNCRNFLNFWWPSYFWRPRGQKPPKMA